MQRFNTLITLIISLMTLFTANASLPQFKTPDFAYPQTVITDADKLLKQSYSASGNDAAVMRLRALLELNSAQECIDPDAAFTAPATVQDAIDGGGLTPAGRAMLLAYQAQLYLNIYTGDEYKYNQVSAPLMPYPADVSLWSGDQFRTRVLALYAAAQAVADDTPLDTFAECLDYSADALQYLPAVSDFVRYRLLNAYGELAYGTTTYTKEKQSLITESVKASAEGTAPFFYWSVEAIEHKKQSPQTRADELNALYTKYSDTEAARYVLTRMSDSGGYLEYDDVYAETNNDTAGKAKYIEQLRQSLEAFPGWYGNAALKNTLAQLTQPKAVVRFPATVATAHEFTMSVDYSNAKTITVSLHTLVGNLDNVKMSVAAKRFKKVAEATVTPDNDKGTATVTLMLPDAGFYAVVLTVDGTTPESYANVIEARPITGFTINGCSEFAGAAVDFTTGAPLGGVVVDVAAYKNRNTTSTYLGKTDKNGLLRARATVTPSRWLTYTYKGRKYDIDQRLRINSFTPDKSDKRCSLMLMSDRALYHPGDSISWAVIAYQYERSAKPSRTKPGNKVCAGIKLTATLKDANYKTIATTEVTTDALGRAYGSFATQKGSLTGNYYLSLVWKDVASARVSPIVSDFKAPVFEVSDLSIARHGASAGVTISGRATTYAGMPVTDAAVSMNVTGCERWRWFVPQTTLGTLTATTDADGNFSIDIPAMMLDNAESGTRYYNFIADVTVTNRTGDTATASKSFTTGKPYAFNIDMPATVDCDAPFTFTINAFDAEGAMGAVPMKWHLRDAKGTIMRAGEGITGTAVTLDLSKLQAGQYSIYVFAQDAAQADDYTGAEAFFYSISRNAVPASAPALFVPVTTAKVIDNTAVISVGTSAEEAFVYAFVADGETLLPAHLFNIKHGFRQLEIPVGTNPDEVNIVLVSVRDGVVYQQELRLELPAEDVTTLTISSFRDHIVPGDTENWQIRLSHGTNVLGGGGVVATMYNAALDALTAHTWPSALYKQTGSSALNVYSSSIYQRYSSVNVPIAYAPWEALQWPAYKFDSYRRSGVILYSKAMATGGMHLNSNYMAADDMAAPTGARTNDMLIVEDSEAEVEDSAPQKKADYREPEVLQAFWRPDMVTDAEGNVDLVFTVPNAIGSWQFKAFGWSADLSSAALLEKVVASKPVMVQSSLPRFLRQGYVATLGATVYNNTENEATIATTIEIFDINTGKVLNTNVFDNTIAAKGNAQVAIDVTAGVEAAAIGFRVRSAYANISDGEQTAIPVLESQAMVIESTEFYLNPKETEPFELAVKVPADASVTLQYCSNPIWTVVKAMRGLCDRGNTTATLAVGNLFSALAAKHIVDGNPDIAAAIKQWAANPSDQELTSMLERNDNLKKLLLDQTPWVQTAADNSSRMAALANLLDSKTVAKNIADTRAALAKLQDDGGGFRWGNWQDAEPSVWVSENVLITLGLARSLGMLPADYDAMLQKAFTWLQTEAAKPKRPATDRELTIIATLFPQYKLTADGKRIITATIAEVAKRWKKHDTVEKAWDVLMLKANGRDDDAAKVLESIRQYGVSKAGLGMTFPSVNDIRGYATIIQAFSTMAAPDCELDAMRQWVIVQAQASDDFGAYNPDYIVAALLLTGSDWTAVPVAGSYISKPVKVTDGTAAISVTPNGITPSYGSVVAIFKDAMTTVASRPGKDISITKRYLVEDNGAWIETTEFKQGQRVRVQLTIQAKRNLEYVSIDDERAAALAPVDQLPGFVWDGNLAFYRENNDASTRLFIGWLPKGSYHVTYDMTAAVTGTFASGIATMQSQYAPELTAHSGGTTVTVVAKQ